MQGKKTFLLYVDMIHIFNELTDQQAGLLIKHIFQYVNDQDPVLSDQLLKIAFAPIKNVLKKDLDGWLNTCERNAENGKKGGRPKKENPEKPKKHTGLIRNQKNPNEPDKDKDKDKDIIIVENEEIQNKVFIEMKNSQRWIEAMCISHKVNPDELLEHLRKFYWHCKTNDYFKDDSSKAKRHFNNWINKGNPIQKVKHSDFKGTG